MHVDDDFTDPEGPQASESDFEKGATSKFDQCFGAIIRQRPQTRPEAGRQDHSSHCGGFHCGAFIVAPLLRQR
jgi:hypothetical protein